MTTTTSRSDINTGTILLLLAVTGGLFSCIGYTPKPRGYFRIEPPAPNYVEVLVQELPYSFNVSALSEIELLNKGWMNICYPSLNATIYCSYLPVTAESLPTAVKETEELLKRQIKGKHYNISRQAFENREKGIYAVLYSVDGDCPSSVQFTLTDSVSRFFRGALYYNGAFNADSIEPVTRYIANDIEEIIQTFCWKN